MGWRLHVRRWGQRGPTILLLHGLGASGRFWRPIAEDLADHFRVVAPDLLGFGLSPWPTINYTLDEHLDALDVTLADERLDGEPLVIVGHSLGANLALAWAARHPSRCHGLVLVSLPAYRSPTWARAHVATLGLAASAVVTRPILGATVWTLLGMGRPLWRPLAPALLRCVPADVAQDGLLHTWRSYSRTLAHCVLDLDVRTLATRVAAAGVPTRLVHGGRDREVPFGEVADLAALTGWALLEVAEADHLLPLDRPGACVSALRELTGHDRIQEFTECAGACSPSTAATCEPRIAGSAQVLRAKARTAVALGSLAAALLVLAGTALTQTTPTIVPHRAAMADGHRHMMGQMGTMMGGMCMGR